jgi:hypothetical protein
MPVQRVTTVTWQLSLDEPDAYVWKVKESNHSTLTLDDKTFVTVHPYDKKFITLLLKSVKAVKCGISLTTHPGWIALINLRNAAHEEECAALAASKAEEAFMKSKNTNTKRLPRRPKKKWETGDEIAPGLIVRLPSSGEFEGAMIHTMRPSAASDPFVLKVCVGEQPCINDLDAIVKFIRSYPMDSLQPRSYSRRPAGEEGNNFTKYGKYPKLDHEKDDDDNRDHVEVSDHSGANGSEAVAFE